MYLMEGGVTLQITSVNIRRIEKENSRMKGIASVLIDDCFAVHDIRIIKEIMDCLSLCQVDYKMANIVI